MSKTKSRFYKTNLSIETLSSDESDNRYDKNLWISSSSEDTIKSMERKIIVVCNIFVEDFKVLLFILWKIKLKWDELLETIIQSKGSLIISAQHRKEKDDNDIFMLLFLWNLNWDLQYQWFKDLQIYIVYSIVFIFNLIVEWCIYIIFFRNFIFCSVGRESLWSRRSSLFFISMI